MHRLLLLPILASVAAATAAPDFERDVAPIFQNHCLDCHDRETLKGGIGLDSFYHATQPTDAGDRLVIAGQPEASVLMHVVEESDPEKRMPPKGDPLSHPEIETLRRWIAAGAHWPDDGWRPARHWSYEVPQKSPLPKRGQEMLVNRYANEIDAFIAAKLDEQGLALNPEAEPARLLRRVHLDLTGLPPSLEQVTAFENDPSFAHYTQIVDQLLASPAYGEKWAVQWLDLARYADSEGYQRDSPRTMWPWRDWVIQALNEDKPFDQFSIEQIAGDLLPGATESQKIATAFHRNTPTNLEAGTDPKEDQYKMIVDRVNTTGTIWLGSTVGCAQCHNHKYDPLSAREYYEIFAFFNQTPMESKQTGDEMTMAGLEPIGPTMQVSLSSDDQATLQNETQAYEALLTALDKGLRQEAATLLAKPRKGTRAIPAATLRILESEDRMSLEQCRDVLKKAVPGKAALNRQLQMAEIAADRLKAIREKDLRIMKEINEMRPTFIAKRGDFLTQGDRVEPGTPAALHPFPADQPRNRLGLAKWLVDPANPLVGRAFINRLWIEVFGQGLVTTPEDLGVQGAPPSHPELLDWLAATFTSDDAWSMKQAVRRLVLSATYRQSVAMHSSNADIDPRNQLLWRHPGHRFNAETLRDQALAISGLLSDRRFGPHVRPYQPEGFWRKTAGASETYYLPSSGDDAYRRGVYTLWRRNAHYPSFANFDAPDRSACTVQRDISNTPLQALTLLNDPVYVEMADAFGKRIATEGGPTLDAQLLWAFRTALSRPPSSTEVNLLRKAYQSAPTRRGFTEVATVLLNLHETLSRN